MREGQQTDSTHARDVAKSLPISHIVIHKYSSILSAYGLSLADLPHEAQRPAAIGFNINSVGNISKTFDELSDSGTEHLIRSRVERERI